MVQLIILSSGSGVTTTHEYMNPGNYTAMLTVGDGNGDSDGAEKIIQVTPPVADI